jgi:5-methylcytosine-specific restriction endonuclease McrA
MLYRKVFKYVVFHIIMNKSFVTVRSSKNIYELVNIKQMINEYKEEYRRNHTRGLRNNFYIFCRIRKERVLICQRCNRFRASEIHHKDLNTENDSLNNLELLCMICHHKRHKLLKSANNERLIRR